MGVISNGTTLLDAGALDSGVPTGSMTLIKTLTASSSANLTFINGSSGVTLDGTYKEYVFKFFDLHPSTNAYTRFQCTTDGSNFNVTTTSSTFASYHDEADSFTALEYRPSADQPQGTALQPLNFADPVGTDNDMCFVGTLHLFNPSSTTFVKHYIATCNSYSQQPMTTNTFVGGYFNTTSAITGIRFQQNTGNMDAGTIKMYGIK